MCILTYRTQIQLHTCSLPSLAPGSSTAAYSLPRNLSMRGAAMQADYAIPFFTSLINGSKVRATLSGMFCPSFSMIILWIPLPTSAPKRTRLNSCYVSTWFCCLRRSIISMAHRSTKPSIDFDTKPDWCGTRTAFRVALLCNARLTLSGR